MEYFGRSPTQRQSQETRAQFTAVDGQTLFTFTYSVGSIDIYINGDHLPDSAFIASNGITVTLKSPCVNGDVVYMVSKTKLILATPKNTYTKDESDSRFALKTDMLQRTRRGYIYFMGNL
jgi:hypothetical protein